MSTINRRQFLGRSGVAVAAAALPAPLSAGDRPGAGASSSGATWISTSQRSFNTVLIDRAALEPPPAA